MYLYIIIMERRDKVIDKALLGELALNAGKKVTDWMNTDDGKAFLCGR